MKISKIKLLNWHIFTNDTISFNNNLLITGENGCGKSTLMDAIYYILSGGDDKSFNQAAGQGGNRTLETYMRCKVGNEGETYLRKSNDVVSYIALELYSEKTKEHHMLGVCLEINDASKPKSNFFYIPNHTINDIDFYESNHVYGYREFKQRMKNLEGYYDFPNAPKHQIRREIAVNIFKIKNHKRFYDLLKKAISFNPITEVSSFVNDFLLEDSRVDLNSLIQQIREYQDFKNMIYKEEEKIKYLDTFMPQAKTYQKNVNLIKYLNIVSKEKSLVNYKNSVNSYNKKIIKLKDENVSYDNELKDLENKNDQLVKDIADLERNDDLKLLSDSKKQLDILKIDLQKSNVELDTILNKIDNVNKVGKHFNFKYNFNTDVNHKDFSLLKIHLNEFESFIYEISSQLTSEKIGLENEKNDIKNKIKENENELNNLEKGKNNYDKEVTLLSDIITNKIREVYPNDEFYVRPLCEYLEVNDEQWSNALEGYLNKQRFNLIIDPKYFDIASKEYERVKDNKNIYGVGIVNISSIKDKPLGEKSLFSKVDVTNEFAKKYAMKLLGNVTCCDSIEEIKNYKSSITKDVMIYKNNVLKACHPDVYIKPYLGLKSRQKRIELLKNDISKLRENEKEVINELEFILYDLLFIKENNRPVDLSKNLWQEISLLEKNINDITSKIKELESDQSLIANSMRIESYKQEKKLMYQKREDIRIRKDNNLRDITLTETRINENTKYIEELESNLKIELNCYLDEDKLNTYRKEFSDKTVDIINKEIESARNYNSKEQQFILPKLSYYVTHYNPSLSPIIENLNDFIKEYSRLINDDIVTYKEKANEAYITAKASFRQDFIAKLREKIDDGKATLKSLNKKLSQHTFGTDKEVFSFEYGPSKDPEFKEYYRIIESGTSMELSTLLDTVMSLKDEEIMKNLFERISINPNNENEEKLLSTYLDYRSYMSFDIKIVDKDNNISHFSEINKEKSGGETQTPFYIIMAACFEELLGKEDSTCCIILDEAFNNMDEDRIKSMMEFYKELNIQVIIIVPTIRFSAIFNYCDTVVGIVKSKNRARIAPIQKNEII